MDKTRQVLQDAANELSAQSNVAEQMKVNRQVQIDMERTRFKQDCRKRALDLASVRCQPIYQYIDVDDLVTKQGETVPNPIVKEDIFIALADKYYDWLIKEI